MNATFTKSSILAFLATFALFACDPEDEDPAELRSLDEEIGEMSLQECIDYCESNHDTNGAGNGTGLARENEGGTGLTGENEGGTGVPETDSAGEGTGLPETDSAGEGTGLPETDGAGNGTGDPEPKDQSSGTGKS